MTISFFDPLDQAWRRTRALLFAPFSVEKWFVIGFAAWLAGLGDGSGGNLGSSFEGGKDLPARVGQAWEHLLSTAGIALLGVAIGGIALVLLVVFLWLSSRAKFVFLDNLVQGRAAISGPWSFFAKLGDSLFRWRLLFYMAALVLVIALCLPVLIISGVGFAGGWNGLGIAAIIYLVATLFVVGVVFLYITFFLDAFVVPIMYRTGLPATEAWKTFLPLFRAHMPTFLLYGILYFFLTAVVGVAIAMVGLMTCCMGFLIFAIPYVGTVALLPVYVGLRYYPLAFLAQFDPRYDLLNLPPAAPAA